MSVRIMRIIMMMAALVVMVRVVVPRFNRQE